jgi:trimeric autotransporter adhesin
MNRTLAALPIRSLILSAVILLASAGLFGQTPDVTVPRLLRFTGAAKDSVGSAMSGTIGVTFALYSEQTGGAPLWLETQNVPVDANGHYSILLGSTKAEGLPADLFVSEQARWVGVQISGQPEQPRVLLVSAPYALKAGDAETVGGFAPSAFVLAQPALGGHAAGDAAAVSNGLSPSGSSVTTTGGTVNMLPLWTTGTNIQSSVVTQTGTGSTARIGIGNTTPAATLDVTGGATIRGLLNLPNAATATATAGADSRPFGLVASTFNSTSHAATNQVFHWQAEPSGNNTASPAATLNLLFATAPAAASETGLKINSKGVITFAPGQTFPGGSGTITGVTAGTGLTGGGTSGSVTLAVDTMKVPELSTSNNFTAPQAFQGNVGIAAAPSSNGYTPLSVGGNTTFGTWFAIGNSSAGGHTWNLISAGSGNAEGAGNFGITDLTGRSTIWLEGNTNTTNLTATGVAAAATVEPDSLGKNAGGPTPGLLFGGGGSGEGIASNRVIGLTKFGLDFYTNFTSRMSVLQNGQVGIGTQNPAAQLAVVASATGHPAIYSQAGDAVSGTGQDGSDGIDAYGSAGDDSSSFTGSGGTGGVFQGGAGHIGGYGIYVTGGFSGASGANTAAGVFEGDVLITGTLYGGTVSRIDHPLDPANKFLSHSAVESSDMKTIYDGNVTTDANGEAVVQLPDWFEALNRDFRYQLTTIGQPAQAWIASKIANHAFAIKTDKPNVEISWQVTGIRQDAWANAHRMPVEQMKSERERGFYLAPELFGAPPEKSITSASHPAKMRRTH